MRVLIAVLATFIASAAVAESATIWIGGHPATNVVVGNYYKFRPWAADEHHRYAIDQDKLTFSISGKPQWATFDTSTGELSGATQTSDVGTYANISISVSDGTSGASLAPFAIRDPVVLAAQESGFPAKVPPSPPGAGASMISARPVTAARGKPPPRDFAVTRISGSIP